MAEYIEREALIADYDRVHKGPAGGARKLMVDAPAADVVEVRHGEWMPQKLFSEMAWCCSECQTLGSRAWKWCPVCGTTMDGKGEGE